MTLAPVLLRAGGRSVPLLAGPNALEDLPRALEREGFAGRLFVVADERALALHGERLPEAPLLAISGAERDKTLEQVGRIWDWLVEEGAQRRDALVAFGGGVVCDLVGFAAACFLRGIGLVNVPTTLLAQVDAAVGGKTGVNHRRGKNLIGAFYQPLCVVADTGLLATLPKREFAAGMAEVAKMAMILDAELFAKLEREADTLGPEASEAMAPIVARSIALKAEIVERDEREDGERMLLNYGHTVGHALEALAGYGTLLHGEAVAIGMYAAAHIATTMGVLDTQSAGRQDALLERLGLPRSYPGADAAALAANFRHDKKRAGSMQRWILAHSVGSGRVHEDVTDDAVGQALEAVTSRKTVRDL